MPQRLRSFIGTIIIICLVIAYAVVATSFATAALSTQPWWVHLSYFVATGLLWIVPAMFIIRWMAGPKPQK
jgi:RsiW-degrading membrane proteinase PrsW (M82 family)